MPCWRGRRGQMKRRGCSRRSSSSTAWCLCLRSTARCSWEGARPTTDHETHPGSKATPSLTETERGGGREDATMKRMEAQCMPVGEAESDGKSILMKTNSRQKKWPKFLSWQSCQPNAGKKNWFIALLKKNKVEQGGFLKDPLPWIGLECSWISQWAVPLTTSHTMIFPEASPEASRRQ